MISKKLAEELYTENLDHLRRVVSAMEKDRARIEDIVQEAFLKAFQAFEQLRDPSKFRAWISRIAVNQCYEY
ncbi:MAG: sigma-70 family RNA polymerase sigma factor, partial [Gracilibacteraceae bacterium]|nr:sigma-70 family RNA polymerase sigma factor [Gracilibacteraceae bacterium]